MKLDLLSRRILTLMLGSCLLGCHPTPGPRPDGGHADPDAGPVLDGGDAGTEPEDGGAADAGHLDGGQLTVHFGPTGYEGAGFQNVVAVNPLRPEQIAAGTDVAGVFLSADEGDTFGPANLGLDTSSAANTAALLFSPTQSGKLYACNGRRGAGGGFWVLDPATQHWTQRSAVPQCSGGNNNNVGPLPDLEHPRSVGNLIVLDAPSGTLFVGTFKNGVMRSDDDGRTWTPLGPSVPGGAYIRGLAADPTDGNTLYAAVYGQGVFVTHASLATSAGSVRMSAVPGSPAHPEELLVLGHVLYVAAGTEGVFKYDGAWHALGRGTLSTSGPNWMSLAGFSGAGGVATLLVGCDQPANATSVFVSTDSGGSFQPFLSSSNLDLRVGGTGAPWWHAASTSSLPGGGGFVASDIVIAPDRETVYVSGRGGVWRSRDFGGAFAPVVKGLMVTFNHEVLADPTTPGRVFAGATDWTAVGSRDGFVTVDATLTSSVPRSAGTVGYGIALDLSTTPANVLVGAGNRDSNTDGNVYFLSHPLDGSMAWVDEKLAPAAGNNRVVSVAMGVTAEGRTLVAAVQEGDGTSGGGVSGRGGVWKKVGAPGSGSWVQILSAPLSAGATLVWPDPKAPLYLLATTLQRCDDVAAAPHGWTQVLPAMGPGTLVAGNAPGVLYVQRAGGISRIDHANASARASPLGSLPQATAVTVDPRGRVWAATSATATELPRLLYWSGTAWVDVAQADDYFHSIAGLGTVSGLAVSAAGEVYVSTLGDGIIRGQLTGGP